MYVSVCDCVSERVTDLFYARLVWVLQGSGLHVFRDQFTAHSGDLLPVPQHSQSQVLLSLLP